MFKTTNLKEIIENDHFDEALDISQHSEDEISSPERDKSPRKNFHFFHDSSVEHDGVKEESDEDETNEELQQMIDGKNKKKNFHDYRDNFFDEAIDVADDDGSIDTDISSKGGHPLIGKVSKVIKNEERPSNRDQIKSKTLSNNHMEKIKSIFDGPTDSSTKLQKKSSSIRNREVFEDTELRFSKELTDLFQLIDAYEPQHIEIETTLKCFIPAYIPAIGDVDPFIKVPRPDGVSDGLGLTVVDEPAIDQSDAAILDLHLRNSKKKRSRRNAHGGDIAVIRSIENAAKYPYEIENWIQNVRELHASKVLKDDMTKEIDSYMLMENIFPEDLSDILPDNLENVLSPKIDLSLTEYAKVLCCLLDIQTSDGHMIQSLHTLFDLFIKNQHMSENEL